MDNEIVQEASNIGAYIPYIFSVLSALASGFASYLLAIRQAKIEIQRLEKQHQLDLETEKERHQMEIQKMKLEHQQQMESKDKEINGALTTTLMNEAIKIPVVQQQIANGVRQGMRRKRR